MHVNIKRKLDRASKITGMSRSYLLKQLSGKLVKNNEYLIRKFISVKYQPADFKENWHQFNIKFEDIEYEHLTDMRNYFKLSVSRIFAYVVTKFLDRLIERLLSNEKVVNNNVMDFFELVQKVLKNGTIHWQTYWGPPEKNN